MRYAIFSAGFLTAVCVTFATLIPPVFAASPTEANNKIIAEATGGGLKSAKGKYFEPSCNESVDYDAEVIDLNGDGQPEVFTQVHGTCLGGMAGVSMNLYIKNKQGQWKPQFGFPGMYSVLKTKHKGFPEIEIGGPGNCFPVWRWNGREYDIHKKCAR